jgi:putative SOS response-associated peptidase YedK
VSYFTKDLKKARKLINARSETVASSGMFREAFVKRRCFVPEPIYDPEEKVPFAVACTDSDPVAFAGIWDEWHSPEEETLRTFSTATTDANNLLSSIEDRMPAIIEPENWPLWLGEEEGDPTTLVRPAAEDVLRFWPVDRKGGNVRNDGSDRIETWCTLDPSLLQSRLGIT